MGVSNKHRALAVPALLALLASLPAWAASTTPAGRVDWDKMTPEQQLAVKAGTPAVKDASTQTSSTYTYVDGVHKDLTVSGSGPQAVFHLQGSSADLRLGGRVTVLMRAAQSLADMTRMLSAFGMTPIRALNGDNTLWAASSAPGLAGVQAINQLQESGKVLSAAPDWQRDLKTK